MSLALQEAAVRSGTTGWPSEAIDDYVMKKERLAVDCPVVCPKAGFVIRGKLKLS